MRIVTVKIIGWLLSWVNFKFYYRFCRFVLAHETTLFSVTRPGFVIQFMKNDPYWSRLISSKFQYEPEVEACLRKYLNEKIGFIDCGANIGYWTLHAAKICRVKHFACVEPNPEIIQILRSNLEINELKAVVHEGAISESSETGYAKFHYENLPGMHAGSSIFTKGSGKELMINVPIISLSGLIKEMLYNVDQIVLKVDIEGAEVTSFKQIDESIRKRVIVIYEDHGSDIDCSATSWLLEHGGYHIYSLSGKSTLEISDLFDVRRVKKKSSVGYNFLAIPK